MMCHGKHCGDNNNCMNDFMALVEYATNGKKYVLSPRQEQDGCITTYTFCL